jgi:hypothetical protein
MTLCEDNYQNVRALAQKADALWSLHGMKTSCSASVASLVDVGGLLSWWPYPRREWVTAWEVVAMAVVVVRLVLLGAEASSMAVCKLRPCFFPGR